MTTQPSPEVQQRLNAMCAQMAVTLHLGEEVKRELYGHMEDKLLAYLNGEELMSEEDALILVREHFGDPALVKGMLQTVHPANAGRYFLRRAAAIICAYTVIATLADRLTMWNMLCLSQMTSIPVTMAFFYPFLPQVFNLTALFLLWATLRSWQIRVNKGRSVWFLEYPGWLLLGICAAVYAVDQTLPAAQVPMPRRTIAMDAVWSFYYPPILLLQICRSVGLGLVCIWWCDRPPRLKAAVFAACVLWAGFMFLRTLLPILQGVVWWTLVTVPEQTDVHFPVQAIAGQFGHLRNSALGIAAYAICSLLVYVVWGRLARRKDGQPGTLS